MKRLQPPNKPQRIRPACFNESIEEVKETASRGDSFVTGSKTPYELRWRSPLGARAVAFAMSQPKDVDVNEILFRPTRQEL